MQNKQLQRQLKGIIQKLRLKELMIIMSFFECQSNNKMTSDYSRKTMNVVSCSISYDVFSSTGFGRSDEQSLTNAIKNLLDTFITSNYEIDLLKKSLKQTKHQANDSPCLNVQDNSRKSNIQHKRKNSLIQMKKKMSEIQSKRRVDKNQEWQNDTLDLDVEGRELMELSNIGKADSDNKEQGQGQGCHCVYYEVHQHHITEIRNLQARMKLIAEQNDMLKELLLKDSASSAIFNKKTQAGKTETIDKENHQKHANTVSIQ